MRSSTSANGGWPRSSQFPRATHRAGGARGRVRERPHLLLREPRARRAGVGHAIRRERRATRGPHPPDGARPPGARALRRVARRGRARRSRQLAPDRRAGRAADGHHAARSPERAHPGGERDRRPRPAPARRDGGDGGGLRLARDGTVGARGGAGARLPARHRPHRRRRGDRRRREPRRRPRVHADRPADPPHVSRLGVAALAILVAVGALALAGPFIWTIPPEATDPAHGLAGLSAAHPPGTDELGRDVLSRLLHGSRVTLLVGVAAMLAALSIGVVVGAIAGYSGGWLDAVLMRFTDAMLAVPAFFFILVVITVSGTGLATLVLVIGGLSWMPVARVVYGETLRWKTAEFVIAATSLGVPARRLLASHILPQAIPSLVVSATLGVAFAILTESALSYLGLGVQPPIPAWGNLLQPAAQA